MKKLLVKNIKVRNFTKFNNMVPVEKEFFKLFEPVINFENNKVFSVENINYFLVELKFNKNNEETFNKLLNIIERNKVELSKRSEINYYDVINKATIEVEFFDKRKPIKITEIEKSMSCENISIKFKVMTNVTNIGLLN